jgi:hypothetical protein
MLPSLLAGPVGPFDVVSLSAPLCCAARAAVGISLAGGGQVGPPDSPQVISRPAPTRIPWLSLCCAARDGILSPGWAARATGPCRRLLVANAGVLGRWDGCQSLARWAGPLSRVPCRVSRSHSFGAGPARTPSSAAPLHYTVWTGPPIRRKLRPPDPDAKSADRVSPLSGWLGTDGPSKSRAGDAGSTALRRPAEHPPTPGDVGARTPGRGAVTLDYWRVLQGRGVQASGSSRDPKVTADGPRASLATSEAARVGTRRRHAARDADMSASSPSL